MKRSRILILIGFQLVINSASLSSQDNVNLKGIVIDSSAEESGIEFVSIGIIGENVGTISNASGMFQISVPIQYLNDTIIFSKIGYYAKQIKCSDLMRNEENRIILEQKMTELREIIITGKEKKEKVDGNISRGRSMVLAINSNSLGSELGTVIRLPKDPVFIKEFNFYIAANHPDSAKFRLNIYDYNKVIGENILKENIYFTIPGKYIGDFSLDLTKHYLFLSNNIFVSVEPIEIFSKGPDPNKVSDKYFDRVNIPISLTGSPSFYRKVSLGSWKRLKFNKLSISPGFWITFIN